MFVLRNAQSIGSRWIQAIQDHARSCLEIMSRAWVINRQISWDYDSYCWRKRVDIAAWINTIRTWLVGLCESKREIIYSVNIPKKIAPSNPAIIHVIPNVFMGGSTQLVVDLHNHLGTQYSMEVVTSASPHNAQHQGMVIHRQAQADPNKLASLLQLRKPDFVHLHYWGGSDDPWYRAFFEAAGALNITVLQNVNTPVSPFNHRTVAMNVFVSKTIRTLDDAANKPGRVIYPGIDLNHFRPGAFDVHASDSIGMVYRLEPDKLNLQSIEPFIEIVKKRPKTRAYIIGDGQLFAPFVRRVKSAGTFSNIVFTGAVSYSRLPKFYKQFKVFVSPVWQESFGQVTPFAMAMGLGVAGNRVGALPEILGGHETLGVDIDDTVQRTIELLDNKMWLAEVGELNRKRAVRMFSMSSMIDSYGALYSDLSGTGRKRYR